MECHFLLEKPMSIPFFTGCLKGNFTAECFFVSSETSCLLFS